MPHFASHGLPRDRILAVAAVLGAMLAASGALADPPSHAGLSEQALSALILDLEADDFRLRSQARDQLSALARSDDQRERFVRAIETRLQDPQVTLEARSTLTALQREAGIPPTRAAAGQGVCSADEAERLVAALLGDRYAERYQAQQQFAAFLQRSENARPVFNALYGRMVDPELTAAAQSQLEPVWLLARGCWLAADAESRRLPEATEEQLDLWIQRLAQGPAAAGARQHEIARLELELRLADDAQRLKLAQRLATAVEGPTQPQSPLQDLYDLTQPTVAAEIWRQGANITIQYLVVGKPQWPETPLARTYTLFDRADERTAHLANGNTLTPGDYPVGVVFPFQAAQYVVVFRLAYLPTPRERMLHEVQAQRTDAERWAQYCRTTLNQYLTEGRELTDAELQALEEFDAEEVSRFVGAYLETIPDRVLGSDSGLPAALVGSRHGLVCLQLAQRGAPSALPGLLKAANEGRISPGNAQAPFALPWIAALAIASRSPTAPESVAAWPQLLDNRQPLETAAPQNGDVGATAAARLLTQAGEDPAAFQLEPVGNQQAAALGCPPAYRFASEDGAAAVRRWWSARQPAATDAP